MRHAFGSAGKVWRGQKRAQRPVSVADLHATIYHALKINPRRNLYTPEDRPVPITDGGHPIRELFGTV